MIEQVKTFHLLRCACSLRIRARGQRVRVRSEFSITFFTDTITRIRASHLECFALLTSADTQEY
jgi:hypothetical protein